MLSLPEVKPFFQKILDEGLSFPKWQQWNAAYFKHGYLLIITLEPYRNPGKFWQVFAKVFEQLYPLSRPQKSRSTGKGGTG